MFEGFAGRRGRGAAGGEWHAKMGVSEDLTGANGTDPRDVHTPGPEQLALAPGVVGQTVLWGSSVRELDGGLGA